MTFLFTPEGHFTRESDEIHDSFRALEFASGVYATTALLQVGAQVEETVLREYQQLFDSYYMAVNTDLLLTAIDGEEQDRSSSATSAKIHSLTVRGEAYPHQFWYLAQAVYSPHDTWLTANLGFTISEAIYIAKSVQAELNNRYSLALASARKKAPAIVHAHQNDWKSAGMTESQALATASVQLSFWQAPRLYRFTIEDVVVLTDLSREVCEAFFRRLSQTPPYRNTFFPATFTDPLRAPWDYNTIKERPFFSDGQGYWVFAPHLLKEVLYSTFFFDLMGDRTYKGTFENSRGRVLEELSADFLRRAFPTASVLINPSYPNGEEFADVCVIHDRKILIVQCKSKSLTQVAHAGEDKAALKRDLEQAISNAAAQGCKGKRFLERESAPFIISDGQRINIDRSKINEISLVAITYMPLQMFATRVREVEEDLEIPHNEFPVWALAIGDLDLVTQICNTPAKLLHYVRRRLLLETGEKEIRADEMDLLAFYLDQGLWLQGGKMDSANMIGLSGYSTSIDEYVFNKFDQGIDAPIPKTKRPDGFDIVIADMESLEQEGHTDCALMLLELSWEASQQAVELIARTKARCLARKDTIPSSMGRDEPAWGMSILAAPATVSEEEARLRSEGFGRVKKYARRLSKFAALGWREGSTKSIDSAIWLDYPFEQDPEYDRLVKRFFST